MISGCATVMMMLSIPERVMVAESQRGKILKGDESFDMDEIRWFFPQR